MPAPRGTSFSRELALGLDRRSLFRLGGGLGLAGLLAACGQAAAADSSGASATGSGSALLPITVSSPAPGGSGSIWDPLQKDRDLVAKHGLTQTFAGGGIGTGQEQLLSKLLDTMAFGPLGVTQANTSGHDVVIVGPQLLNHGRWIVPADSSATRIDDLKGKRVGVQPASSDTYRAAALAAAVNGLTFDKDFQLFPGQPIANLALYERGDLDAIIAIEPNATRLVAAGNRQLAAVADLWQQGTGNTDPLFLNGSAFRRDWLEANTETARRYVALATETNQIIVADPTLIARYHSAYGVPDDEEKAIDLLPDRLKGVYATRWDAATFANIDKQIDVAVQIGLLDDRAAEPVYRILT